MTSTVSRKGFTLVELLVVTSLLAGFFGLVISAVRPSSSSQIRQLTQSLSSSLLAAQTRALGNDAGAALILEPGTGSIPAVASNSVFNADIPPFIIGEVVSGVPPTNLSSTSAAVSLTPTNADAADLTKGYKIRFSSDTPYMAPSPWLTFATGTASLRSPANQTSNNTIWPISPAGGELQFAIVCYPQKSSIAADATRLAAIDLRYSGIGNTVTGNYGSLDGKGSIAICFDRTGGLDSVIQYGSGVTPTVLPLTPTAPLYLLIASLSDIQANQPLQSQGSRWLAIAPSTGRVTVAANVVVSGTNQDAVIAARANARQGVTGGIK